MESRRVRIKYLDGIGYLAVSLVVLTFIWLVGDFLLRAPEAYPLWDQRSYYKLAGLARALLAGEPNSWTPFWTTFSTDYNALFALPLAPALIVFGASYYVYGMAIAVIYGTAASLTVSAVAAVILAGYRPWVIFLAFAATALVAATRSAIWFAVIWYYPDVGDAVVFALWIIAAILMLRRPNWPRTCAVAVLTVAVLLFRRHLLFPWAAVGIGLTISVAIQGWLDWWRSDPQGRPTRLRAGAIRIGALAVSAILGLGMVLALTPQFVASMTLIIIRHPYVDFEKSPAEVILAMIGAMGIIPVALSAAGYVASAVVFRSRRFDIIGVGLGAIGHVVLWVFVARQLGPHYWIVPGAVFVPIGIGLGVGALAEKLGGLARSAALATAFVLVLLSAGRLVDGAVSGIMDPAVSDAYYSKALPSPPLLQGRVTRLSLHRGMEGPLSEVFARMAVDGPQPKMVFVVTSSVDFNEPLFQSAAEALLGDRAKSYFFYASPVIDSRDRLPVNELMEADFVLIDDKQSRPTIAKGFTAVRDMFSERRAAALDFARIGKPVAFRGFSVSIYQRVRESDERTATTTIDALRSAVTSRGYGQPSWIEISRRRRGEPIQGWGKGDVLAYSRIQGDGWPARYLSYDKPPVGRIELKGVGNTTCPQGTLIALHVVTSDGTRQGANAIASLVRSEAKQSFSLAINVPTLGSRLELEIDPPMAKSPCDVRLRFYPRLLFDDDRSLLERAKDFSVEHLGLK